MGLSFESGLHEIEARPGSASSEHRPRLAIPRRPQDDFGLVGRADGLPLRRCRVPFRRDPHPLAWAKQYVFEAIALSPVILTQIDIWTNVDDNRAPGCHRPLHPGACFSAAGRRSSRLSSSPLAPFVFTLLDADAAYNTDTMFLPLLLSWPGRQARSSTGRLAITALGAVLVAGWTVFIRASEVPWTELIWLCFPSVRESS